MANMQKLLIISYFFPPCNLTASQRTLAWSQYLHEFGFYPIIISRKWEKEIIELKDMSASTSKGCEIKKDKKHTIIRVPFSGSLKDRLYSKYGDTKWSILRKFLSLFEIIMQNFFVAINPSKLIYYKAKSILQNDSTISKVIITGSPFICFYYGYLLKKKFPHIKWIADYRDDWSTTDLKKPKSVLKKVLFSLEKNRELKWLSNASTFTTVSEFYEKKINNFILKKGHVLLNGYDEKFDDFQSLKSFENEFIITYNGSLYHSQDIEPFIMIIIKLIKEFKEIIKIKLLFPGLAFDNEQKYRVEKLLLGFENHYWISGRIERKKVIQLQFKSHLLLMISHKGLKGIPSSKLYEYVGLKKPILLYPNDKDIIEKTLIETGLGVVCNSTDEMEKKLRNIIYSHIKKEKNCIEPNLKSIQNYTRKNQTKILANIINSLNS